MSVNTDFYVVMVGRFLYGMVAGLLFGLVPTMFKEYLPYEEYVRGYGGYPNLAIELFKTVFLMFNIAYLSIKTTKEEDSTPDWYWKFNYLLPLPFMFTSLVLFICCSRKNSFHHLIRE